ncbi:MULTISPECIES: hypothetical protein [Paenibacillus]|uniref:hypothetical protein n=1 Tax=Paenibacillus TaxID=44249 RepID=UPI00096DF529|nr:hypothetical protein [Paenibacillus odorifer]OMD31219.1 hypothetical protein BJP48_15285 [Paenibacillus odorifer]OME30421.1 hypothetical protein BSK63_18005 [Paenibacillus odorifer]OME34501.1 hypothetical protein BSK46_20805 [Paenibacillus odorifer]OME52212.1 hypothetical protein BSK61_19090 [Paenibacillus odorifer]OZQ63454.1 hypothetical protein CA596_29500 [Paenibacillus odorifer]
MSNNNNTYERTDMIDPPLKVRGSLFVRENIRAVTVDVFGHLSTKSSVSTSKLKVSGDCTIGGNCKANQVNNLGSLRVQNIQADNLRSSGYMSVAENAAAGTFYAEGAVNIKRLNADSSIEIRLGNRSTVEVMRAGGDIIVKPSSKLINALMHPFRKLTCTTIEGTSITLYRTTADLVCGEEIIVGPGCTIGEIRYSKSLTVDLKSQVDRTVFLNP